MILGFSVTNHRSIFKEQSISFLAGPDSRHQGNVHEPNLQIRGLKHIKTLKSIVLYGHNAAGKSNLFHAIQFMKETILKSSDLKQGDQIQREPFSLSSEGILSPTAFHIAFLLDGARYDYSFKINSDRVLSEQLLVNDRGSTKCVLDRTADQIELFGAGQSANIHRESTKSNVLFLSWAAFLNDPWFSKIYLWFKHHLTFYNGSGSSEAIADAGAQLTARLAENDKDFKSLLLSMIQMADLGIIDLRIKPHNFNVVPDEIKEYFNDKFIKLVETSNPKFNTIKLVHQAKQGPMELNYKNESAGTRKLISLAGPMLNALAYGHTIFIDEFESHLHPILGKALFELFNNPDVNFRGAQLVIGTHLLELMDQKIIRRDQVFFAEKNKFGATKYYPMLDYRVRNTESLSKGYLAGRYGAIPRIKKFESLESSPI